MICIQKKKVFEVNYEDFSQNFVRNFYLNNYDNLKVVIVVKKNNTFYANVSFEEVCALSGKDAVAKFIEKEINKDFIMPSSKMFDEAGKIYKKKGRVFYIPLISNENAFPKKTNQEKESVKWLDFFIDIPIPGIGLDMVDYVRNMDLQETYKTYLRKNSNGTVELGGLNELNYRLYELNSEIGTNMILHDERWTEYLGIKSLCEPATESNFTYDSFFSRNAYWTYTAVDGLWLTHMIYKEKCYSELYKKLSSEGVKTLWCRLTPKDLKPQNKQSDCSKSILHEMFYSVDLLQTMVGDYYYKKTIYGVNAAEYSVKMASRSNIRQMGDEEKTLYLVGPCTIGADFNFEGQRMFEILYEKLKEISSDYKLVPVLVGLDAQNDFMELLSKTIYSDDIVLVLDAFGNDILSLTGKDGLSANDVFSEYDETDWLYTDTRMHTTEKGNRILAERIMEKLVVPTIAENNIEKHFTVHQAEEKQFFLTPCHQRELDEYFRKNAEFKKNNSSPAKIGAITMNANPFTEGHKYLTEFASKKVDLLYVMVVEEDKSEIPFHDRFEMVKKGCKEFKNVRVITTSRLHLSFLSMPDYFRKNMVQEGTPLDFWKDIFIYTHYFVPFFGITDRFLGEEPSDYVTAEYNKALEKSLPNFCVKLTIIPRKEVSGNAISGTKVREYAKNIQWDKLKDLVPLTTLEHLKFMAERDKQ